MELLNRKTNNLENVNNKVFFIYHCEDTVESFFKNILEGSKVEDGYILQYEGKEYSIDKLEPVGVELQRDIYIYKLTEFTPSSEEAL